MRTISTISTRSFAAHKANWTRKVNRLERALDELENRSLLAFAACRSIRFANDQAVRHGGDYSLNNLLAADKRAREALAPAKSAKKGGAK